MGSPHEEEMALCALGRRRVMGAALVSVNQVRPSLNSPWALDILDFSTGELAGFEEKSMKAMI